MKRLFLIRRCNPCFLSTFNRLPFGQNGDGALCHLFLVQYGGDLGAPAVRADPDEMPRLIGLLSCLKESPVCREKGKAFVELTCDPLNAQSA